MNAPRFSRVILDNGLTVLLQEKDTGSTSFGIGIRFGSVHHSGAHFLEHLLFKGTNSRTHKDINRQAVQWGGSLDAFTDFFSTFYMTKNLSCYAHGALELMCDMVSNSTIPLQEMECEKMVFMEEIKMRSEEPEFMLVDALYKNLYHEHPIGKVVLDSRQSVCCIGRDNILEIYRKFYIPSRIVIVGVGKIDKKIVFEIAKKYFRGPRKLIDDSGMSTEESLQYSGRIVIPQAIKQLHLMVGFKTVPCTHQDYYPLRVLSAIMGENINSRLYEKARERQGLVYNITSHYDIIRSSWQSYLKADCSRWHGALRIYTRFSPRNLLRIQKVIKEGLQKLAQKEFSEEELLINKQKLVGERKLATLGTFKHMCLLFASEINDSISDFDKFSDKIYAVTSSDVIRVARQYCAPDNAVWVVLKP